MIVLFLSGLYLLEENIIQYILYRYNPYFPHKDLPSYDIGPANPEDPTVKLGDNNKAHASLLTF